MQSLITGLLAVGNQMDYIILRQHAMRIVFLVYSQLTTLYDFIFACKFIRFLFTLFLHTFNIIVRGVEC